MDILDWIFPKRCVFCGSFGSYLCPTCFSFLSFDVKNFCLVCKKPSFNGLTHPLCKRKFTIDGCFSAVAYNRVVRKLVLSFKKKPYISDLKGILSELMYESLIQNEQFEKELSKEWILVPVPLFRQSFRKRGYNQSQLLAKELSKKLGIREADILERGANDKFVIKKDIYYKNIFLVDDVWVSGSTLLEATKVLKRNRVKRVVGIVLTRKEH
jgi:predicted amidophosphoribosyltransferase